MRNSARTAVLARAARDFGPQNFRMGVRKFLGFSLIELCFGVALIAILGGLAVPGFRSALRAAAVQSATFELAAGLQETRASSIVEARPGVFCLSDAAGSCVADSEATAWTAFLDVGDAHRQITARALPTGIVLHATRSRLQFWPDSRAASTGTLTICDAQGIARPRALVLSQLGRARLAEASDSDCQS
jgi:Tfp pilus assembly protein FimT